MYGIVSGVQAYWRCLSFLGVLLMVLLLLLLLLPRLLLLVLLVVFDGTMRLCVWEGMGACD